MVDTLEDSRLAVMNLAKVYLSGSLSIGHLDGTKYKR